MKHTGLKPSQVCDLLQVSASTLRAWSVSFGESLSPEARGEGGRHRSYLPADVAVLQRAANLLQTHTMADTAQLLRLADDTQSGALVLASLPAIAGEMQALRDAMMQLRSDVAALADKVTTQQAELEAMRASFAQYAARQAKRSKLQRDDLAAMRAEVEALKAPRHWWQRLRGG